MIYSNTKPLTIKSSTTQVTLSRGDEFKIKGRVLTVADKKFKATASVISALRVANRVIASKSQFVEAASVSPGEKKEKSRKEKSSGIRFVTDRGVFFAPEGTATVVKLEGDVGQFFGPASWEEYAAGPDSEELPSAAKSAWKKSLALKDQFKYVHYMAGYEAEEQVLVVFSNAPLKKMSTAIDDARHFYDPRGLKVPGPGMIFFNLDH